MLFALLAFIFGLMVGSFLNVLIPRTITGEDWVRGRSKCPECEHLLAWYDNIPLVSYLMLRGTCRYCGVDISIHYPAVELLTGLLFLWWYMMGFAFFRLSQTPFVLVQPVFWLVVGVILVIIFVTDWMYQIIPDYATVSLGILALGYRLYLSVAGVMQWQDLVASIMTGVVMFGGFFGLWYITKGRGMGFGDVKYVLVMGWLLGWPRAVIGVFVAFVLGAVVGVVLILGGKKEMGSKIAFGPFLVLGTVAALLWGAELWAWYWGLV